MCGVEEVYFSETDDKLPVSDTYEQPSMETLRSAAETLDQLESLETLFGTYREKMLKMGEADELLAQGYEEDDHVVFYMGSVDSPEFVDSYVIGEQLAKLEADVSSLTVPIVDHVQTLVSGSEEGAVEADMNEAYAVVTETFKGDADNTDLIDEFRESYPEEYHIVDRYASRRKSSFPARDTLDRFIERSGIPNFDDLFSYVEDVAHFVKKEDELREHGETFEDVLRTAQWAEEAEEQGRALVRATVDRHAKRVNDESSVQPFSYALQEELGDDSDDDVRGIA